MVAQSLKDIDHTIQRLVGIQAAAGIILLVLLAGIGTYVVRRSLRGLEDVEHTAVAIAGGDLSQRVPQRDPRTEVGRLSLALNQMLGQIETAFAQRTASELAARRSEETARESEEAARQSEEAARQSEDRMRRFVADASHELRTPLTSIRGFAELSRQRGDTTDPDTMRRIEDEAKRMGLLVDDLLLLARLDQQRPLKMESVDLLPIAADALHNAQAVQPGRNISLKILQDSEAPVVEGDEARLRQVLGNLVSNALHHTPLEAPITVSVGTRGDEAILEVSDTGPGLSRRAEGQGLRALLPRRLGPHPHHRRLRPWPVHRRRPGSRPPRPRHRHRHHPDRRHLHRPPAAHHHPLAPRPFQTLPLALAQALLVDVWVIVGRVRWSG